jgi:dipeptidase
MYATITQSRDWLPDEIGGKVWLAMDNVASSIYIPVYSNISYLPNYYSTEGRTTGFNRQSAWWAFNFLGTLTAQRWGDMRKDIDAVWNPWQNQMFSESKSIEDEALRLYNLGKKDEMKIYLTKYTNDWGIKVVEKAWILSDHLLTKYDEKW